MKVAGVAYEPRRVDVVLVDLVSGDPRLFGMTLNPSSSPVSAARGAAAVLRTSLRLPWDLIEHVSVERHIDVSVVLSRMQGAILAAIPPAVNASEAIALKWREEFSPGRRDDAAIVERAHELGFCLCETHSAVSAYRAFALAWTARARWTDQLLERAVSS